MTVVHLIHSTVHAWAMSMILHQIDKKKFRRVKKLWSAKAANMGRTDGCFLSAGIKTHLNTIALTPKKAIEKNPVKQVWGQFFFGFFCLVIWLDLHIILFIWEKISVDFFSTLTKVDFGGKLCSHRTRADHELDSHNDFR